MEEEPEFFKGVRNLVETVSEVSRGLLLLTEYALTEGGKVLAKEIKQGGSLGRNCGRISTSTLL